MKRVVTVLAICMAVVAGCASGPQDWSKQTAEVTVSSGYVTYRQEIRQRQILIKDSIGTRTNDGQIVGETPTRIETIQDVVNVPVTHEIAFDVYRGTVKILSGVETPAVIHNLEVNTEYTIYWYSPSSRRNARQSFTVTPGGFDKLFGPSSTPLKRAQEIK